MDMDEFQRIATREAAPLTNDELQQHIRETLAHLLWLLALVAEDAETDLAALAAMAIKHQRSIRDNRPTDPQAGTRC